MAINAAFLLAVFLAFIMGFAIQRGATCAVIAVHEVVDQRRASRLLAMLEAAIWVAGGLLLAQTLGLLDTLPAGHAVTGFTVLGGVLLGLGAYVNNACVFGAIARLGSGQWVYLAMPMGFYIGCVSVNYLFAQPALPELTYGPFAQRIFPWAAAAFIAFMVLRLGRPLYTHRRSANMQAVEHQTRSIGRALAQRVWSPHAATTVIGLTFFLMLLLVGAWSYTDVLTELARTMMAVHLGARIILLIALLSGAMLGGWTAGLLRSTAFSIKQLASCFAGGMLMGWGSLLIPGGNDGLILVGMPLLWPYAWVAFASMCLTIATTMIIRRALQPS